MALINKHDFSIVSSITIMDYKTSEDYFKCDDLIAPAVALLNKKGYTTVFSCSGHPFSSIDSWVMEEKPTKENIGLQATILHVESSENVKDGYNFSTKEFPYHVIVKNDFCDMIYVSFDKEYKFPNLPKGAHFEKFTDEVDDVVGEIGIYWDLDDYPTPTDNFDSVARIYEINKIFYEWVETLPSLKEKV